MEPLSFGPDALSQVVALEGDAHVERTLGELPVGEADAVRARVLDGTSYKQIAIDLRCSPQVARKRVSRGLARLRARKETM